MLATVLSVALGLLAACRAGPRQQRYRETILGLLLSPLVIPELVIGLALLQMLTLMNLATDLLTLVLAHTVICLPYTVRLLYNGVSAINESLENASLLLGASRGGTIDAGDPAADEELHRGGRAVRLPDQLRQHRHIACSWSTPRP